MAALCLLALVLGTAAEPGNFTSAAASRSPLIGDGRLFYRLSDNGACRGSTPQDNNPSDFQVLPSVSLEDCRKQCLQHLPECKGIGYSPGRCEIWVRPDGIFNTAPLAGSVCERFGWPVERLLVKASTQCFGDGGSGDLGSGGTDWDMNTRTRGGLEDCKAMCSAAPVCFGIEYNQVARGYGHCKVWKRPFGSTYRYAKDLQCLHFPDPRGFEVVTSASGSNGPCRGLSPNDNNAHHYNVPTPFFPGWGIHSCRSKCLANLLSCKGIEFSKGRCEVWTRPEGIYHVAEDLPSFTCERYGWPVKGLRRMDPVGTWGACRDDTEKDNSADYYQVLVQKSGS